MCACGTVLWRSSFVHRRLRRVTPGSEVGQPLPIAPARLTIPDVYAFENSLHAAQFILCPSSLVSGA